MKRLLVTGIPGTGKTMVGNHLQTAHRVSHVNMEDDATRASFARQREAFVAGLPDPVVVTWGFHPVYNPSDILFLKDRGLFLVWMDGDRPAALRAFLARGNVCEAAFYMQMFNIEQTQVVSQVMPQAFVNPFRPDGRFRDVDDIAQQLLGLVGDAAL